MTLCKAPSLFTVMCKYMSTIKSINHSIKSTAQTGRNLDLILVTVPCVQLISGISQQLEPDRAER